MVCREFLFLGRYTSLPGGVLRALLFKNRTCNLRKGFLGGKLASLLLHKGSSSSRSRGMWSFLNLILTAKLFFLARQEAIFKAELKDD